MDLGLDMQEPAMPGLMETESAEMPRKKKKKKKPDLKVDVTRTQFFFSTEACRFFQVDAELTFCRSKK